MKLKELIQTCTACPSQWEGRTEDDFPIYVRYRWGYLSIRKGEKGSESAVEGTEIYSNQMGEDLDGTIAENTVLKIIEKL